MARSAVSVLRGKYFIAGTDTDAGKTYASCYLLDSAKAAGISAIGFKPVAAGAAIVNGELCNDDALKLQASSSLQLSYRQVNPICLREACSPHIAAQLENSTISVQDIVDQLAPSLAATAGVKLQIIEGAGGWLVPLNDRETMADLARAINWPVILVVGMKLGCINHALLSAAMIEQSGLTLAGWVANSLGEKMPWFNENLQTLTAALGEPLAVL